VLVYRETTQVFANLHRVYTQLKLLVFLQEIGVAYRWGLGSLGKLGLVLTDAVGVLVNRSPDKPGF